VAASLLVPHRGKSDADGGKVVTPVKFAGQWHFAASTKEKQVRLVKSYAVKCDLTRLKIALQRRAGELMAKGERLISLDVFSRHDRGRNAVGLNNWTWSAIYPPLEHAQRNG
jgi:hypothetical protein